MIIHIAIFQWKPNVSKNEIERALEDVRALKSKVDGIIDILCGENFSKWNEGFTHAVIVTTKNRKALEEYRKHPDHQDVAERINRMEIKSIGIDFEA